MEVLKSTTVERGWREPQVPAGACGFSLVEVLVSLLLLAFVALGIMGALDQGLRFNSSSRDYTAISNLAKGRLEHLLALPFDDAMLDTGQAITEATPDGQYTVSYVVTEHSLTPATPNPQDALATPTGAGTGNLKLIRVTVSSERNFGVGRRNITVEAVKHAH